MIQILISLLFVAPTYSENIEYCANIIYNPTMSEEFEKQCSIERTNNYIMEVKQGQND